MEMCFISFVCIGRIVGVVETADELHLAGDAAEPVDRVALDVHTRAANGLIAEDLWIENGERFLVQDRVRTYEWRQRHAPGFSIN